MRSRHNIQFTIKNISGDEKVYNLLPLKRKEAAWVAHTFLRTLLRSLSDIINKGGQEALFDALASIDFSTIWRLGGILLKNAEIRCPDRIVRIDDLEECEYFEDNPEELYLAIFHGVKENYPNFFSKGLLGLVHGGLGPQASQSRQET